jgi:hypothetical protein
LYAFGLLVLALVLTPFWVAVITAPKRPRRGGGVGAALSELNGFFDPASRQTAKVQEERPLVRKDDEPLP